MMLVGRRDAEWENQRVGMMDSGRRDAEWESWDAIGGNIHSGRWDSKGGRDAQPKLGCKGGKSGCNRVGMMQLGGGGAEERRPRVQTGTQMEHVGSCLTHGCRLEPICVECIG